MIAGLLRRLGFLGPRYTLRTYTPAQYLRSRDAGSNTVRMGPPPSDDS